MDPKNRINLIGLKDIPLVKSGDNIQGLFDGTINSKKI